MKKTINTSQKCGCWNFCLTLIATFIAINGQSRSNFSIEAPLTSTLWLVDEQPHQTDSKIRDLKDLKIVWVDIRTLHPKKY